MSKLMVIVPDRISDILVKGEYQPCYYNPGEVFAEVHIVTTTDDRPSLDALQRTVGKAKLFVHNVPDDLNLVGCRPVWWRNYRLRRWAKAGVDLARRVRPDLIRCHGADWNAYLASRIKAKLGIPYVVSLHTNPDVGPLRRFLNSDLSAAEKRHNAFYEHIERVGLENADLVMPVYKPIIPYLRRLGITNYAVFYNILNGDHLRQKTDYRLHRPARIIYVGRLLEWKDPTSIIRAITQIPDTVLTIVGDGPIRPRLEQLVAELGLIERVVFQPAIDNDALCAMLPDQDIFAVHSKYFEISKAILEAFLTGLPVVTNRRSGDQVPEFEGNFLQLVEDTPDAYRHALRSLLDDDEARAELGRRALAHSRANWDPAVTEARVVELYRSILERRA